MTWHPLLAERSPSSFRKIIWRERGLGGATAGELCWVVGLQGSEAEATMQGVSSTRAARCSGARFDRRRHLRVHHRQMVAQHVPVFAPLRCVLSSIGVSTESRV